MKQLFFLILMAVITTSCHIVKLPYTHTPTQPYVQTKDGHKIMGSSVERKGPFVWGKVVIDGKQFKPKEVAFYADNRNVYANVGRHDFATQVAAGPINLYRTEKTVTEYGGGPSGGFGGRSGGFGGGSLGHTHKYTYYYIQGGDAPTLKTLKYKNLKPLVSLKSPAGKVLEKYRTRRITTRCLGYGVVGGVVGGMAIIAAAPLSVGAVGLGMVATGFMAWFPYVFTIYGNQKRLLQTVVVADKDGVSPKVKPIKSGVSAKDFDLSEYVK